MSTSVVKCSEVERSLRNRVSIIIRRCTYNMKFVLPSYSFGSVFCHCTVHTGVCFV